MRKLFFLLFAIAITTMAVAFSDKEPNQTYWFPTDSAGNILNMTIPVQGHTEKPCDGLGDYCALGFTTDEVIVNQDGTVTLREEVEPIEDGEPSLEE